MEEIKSWLPLILAFGFPAVAMYMKRNVLKDYIEKTTHEALKSDVAKLEAQFHDHVANQKEEKKVLWDKFDAMKEDLSDIKTLLGRIDERTKKSKEDHE